MLRGFFYRIIMRMSHRFNWHYAPPIYPDGDTQLWCKWCGFRQTIARAEKSGVVNNVAQHTQPESGTGSIPHRNCKGCAEYERHEDRDCSGNCP